MTNIIIYIPTQLLFISKKHTKIPARQSLHDTRKLKVETSDAANKHYAHYSETTFNTTFNPDTSTITQTSHTTKNRNPNFTQSINRT